MSRYGSKKFGKTTTRLLLDDKRKMMTIFDEVVIFIDEQNRRHFTCDERSLALSKVDSFVKLKYNDFIGEFGV